MTVYPVSARKNDHHGWRATVLAAAAKPAAPRGQTISAEARGASKDLLIVLAYLAAEVVFLGKWGQQPPPTKRRSSVQALPVLVASGKTRSGVRLSRPHTDNLGLGRGMPNTTPVPPRRHKPASTAGAGPLLHAAAL